ncbi:MAG: hypothetical protein ABFD07_01955 [Methanobacterium sp.]
MKIIYDKVSPEYSYPLSKDDVAKIKKFVKSENISKLRTIEFGCNTKTTQEGRTVQRGKYYDIRINFCLKNMSSLILSENKKYIDQIRLFAGSVDFESRLITWNMADAKRYALFLLLHEIGHIIYSERHSQNNLSGASSKHEEQWCDRYAMEKINIL